MEEKSKTINTEGELKSSNTLFLTLKGKAKLIVVAIVILLAGLSFVFLSSQKTTKVGKMPPPEPKNVLLATVGDKKIYRNDVKKIALGQYLQSAIDGKVMRVFLDTAIERAILEYEALKLGIATVSEAEKNEAYYTKIKEKIINGRISKINATQIGWWIPPSPDYPQLPLYNAQRSEGEKAVLDIKTQLIQGIQVISILKNTYDRYPLLQSILSINGVRYTGQTNADGLPINRDYQYDKLLSYFPKNKLMMSMKEGEVKSGIWEDKSGAVVIKVNKITKGERVGYSEWLQEKIRLTVTYNTTAVKAL